MAEDGLIRDITVNNLDVQGSLKINSNIIDQSEIDDVISGMFFTSSENGSGNTGYGYQTPGTTGSGEPSIRSTSIGYQACKTGGRENTAIGYQALESSSSTGNTAIGFKSGNRITGNYNVSIGYNARVNDDSSDSQLAIGSDIGNWITGDSSGIVTIPNSLIVSNDLTVTEDIILNGSKIKSNNNNETNTVYGKEAFYTNTSNGNNTAIGYQALYNNSSTKGYEGSNNVGIGTQALYGNTAGAYNVALGNEALYRNIIGSYNTAIGYNSLLYSDGFGNVALGNEAGKDITRGNYNVCIGYNTQVNDNTSDSQLAIGTNNGTNNIKWISGDSSGKIKIENGIKGDVEIGEDSTDLMVVNSETRFSNIKIENGIKGDVEIGEDSTDLMVVNSETRFSNNVDVGTDLVVSNSISTKNVTISDIIYISPGNTTNGDGDIITQLLLTHSKVVLTGGTYTIKSGYPIRITSNNKILEGTNGSIIKLGDNAYEPCIYIGTKNAGSISNILVNNLKIDGNRGGNLARGAECEITYDDDLVLSSGDKITLYDKNGTPINFIEGNKDNSSGNDYYYSGYIGVGASADDRAIILKNAIDQTEHFSASIDTSTNTITITQTKNNDNSEDAHISSTNTALNQFGSSMTDLEVSNFITREVRETSGTLTNPVAKNNGIVVHNVTDLTVTNCFIENTLSGGIVCGDKCVRVKISDCKSRGHVFDGMAFDGPHEDFSISNCTLYENDFAGFSLDTGIVGGFNITNCHCVNNHSEGFYIRKVNDIAISNCVVKYNNKHGIAIQKVNDNAYPKNIHISNCLIEESGKLASNDDDSQKSKYDGIQISKGYNVMLTGCNIINNSKRGVSIESNSENINISNCNFISNGEEAHDAENNSGDAIFLSNSNNINISNSLFKDNFSSAIQVENFASPVDGIAITKDININCCSFYNHATDKCIRINGFSNGGIENVTVNSCIFRNNNNDIHCQVWLQQSGDFEKNKSYTIKDIGTGTVTNWADIDSNNLTAYVKGTVIKTPDFDTDAEILAWEDSQTGDGWAAGANNIIISNNIFIKEGGNVANTVIGTHLNPSGTGIPQVLFDINNTIIENS